MSDSTPPRDRPRRHTSWTAEELRQLDGDLGLYGMDWQQIADRHGRSVRAVQQMATKIGAKR